MRIGELQARDHELDLSRVRSSHAVYNHLVVCRRAQVVHGAKGPSLPTNSSFFPYFPVSHFNESFRANSFYVVPSLLHTLSLTQSTKPSPKIHLGNPISPNSLRIQTQTNTTTLKQINIEHQIYNRGPDIERDSNDHENEDNSSSTAKS